VQLADAVGKSKDKKPRAVLLSGKTARGWLFSVTAFWEEAGPDPGLLTEASRPFRSHGFRRTIGHGTETSFTLGGVGGWPLTITVVSGWIEKTASSLFVTSPWNKRCTRFFGHRS